MAAADRARRGRRLLRGGRQRRDGLGTAHRGLAAVALPPLAALVAAAWVEYRRLLVPSVTVLAAFLAAALVISKPAHLALAGLSLAATLVVTAETFRGEPVHERRGATT